jgi:hypothetical protein
MTKPPFITHTAQNGEIITYQFRNILGLKFLSMVVNFDPIDHIFFGNTCIPSIPGITRLTSVTIDKGKKGTYFFGLTSTFDQGNISKGIENEFNTYFLQVDNKPIP